MRAYRPQILLNYFKNAISHEDRRFRVEEVIRMIIFKSVLFKSCNSYYTGKFHLEFYDSQIVVFDKLGTIIPLKKVTDKQVTIPVDMCLRYIDKIIENSFFGEIDLNIKSGKICEVRGYRKSIN